MNGQLKALHLLNIPVWVERKYIATPITAACSAQKTTIFLQETAAKFSSAHQEQLQRICAYLQIHSPLLVYADTKPKPKLMNAGINFGLQPETLAQYSNLIHTLSITEMLTNPSCKRQVQNDLKAFIKNT